ncbi:MAG: hypothetical protein Q4C45_06875, partial [Oscillospiraceae bacterium]|nr:hypothetical protein [Oscillospiraceae bacterium]
GSGSSGGSSGGGDSGGSSGSGTGTGSGGTTQKTYTWEEYMELSPEKQEAFFAGFTDPAGFFAWQQEAKAAYDAAHPSVEIGKDGTIDLGGLVKP